MPAKQWDLSQPEQVVFKNFKYNDMLIIEEVHGDKYLIMKKTPDSEGGFTAHNEIPKDDDIFVKFI